MKMNLSFHLFRRALLMFTCSIVSVSISPSSAANSRHFGPANPAQVAELQKQARREYDTMRRSGAQSGATFRPEYLTDAEQRLAQVTLVEGDVELDSKHLPLSLAANKLPAGLNQDAVRDTNRLWPNARIPFVIDDRMTFAQRQLLHVAFQEYAKQTCLRFVEKTDADVDYLFIRPVHLGCYSKIGWEHTPKQRVSFHPTCFEKFGTILHELMHSVGFFHEQARSDRDDWVTIRWDKIQPLQEHNFEKLGADEIFDYGKPYDYGSLLHYQADAFPRTPGDITIEPKQPLAEGVKMGQREYFSQLDVEKLNNLYNCSSRLSTLQCSQGEIPCGASPNGGPQCGRLCDGIAQCADGSDETNLQCPAPQCENDEYWPCKSSKCIRKSWLCDGVKDCAGGEDELSENCNERRCNEQTEFNCGKCIPLYLVCDGKPDCLAGQDEEPKMCAQRRSQQPPPPSEAQPQETSPTPPSFSNPTAQFSPAPCRYSFQSPPQQLYSDDAIQGGIGRGANRFRQQQAPVPFHQQPFSFNNGWPPQQQPLQSQFDDFSGGAQQYQCASSNQCYTAAQRCDGYWSCPDGSDENGCNNNNIPPQSGNNAFGPPLSSIPAWNPYYPSQPRPPVRRPPQQPNYNPYFSFFQPQPFGQSLQNLFNFGFDPYSGPFFSDPVDTVQRHCFINTNSFEQRPEIRFTPVLLAQLLSQDPSPCSVAALGHAQINLNKLNVYFSSSSGRKALSIVQKAQLKQEINGFVIVIGGSGPGGDMHLRQIGSNVTQAMQFAENLRQTLRTWNATGVVLEWLRPTAHDRAALNTVIKTLAEAMQFDPALHPTAVNKTSENSKKRMVIGMNILNAIQPAQDQQLLLTNVDFFNILPDPREAAASEHTFYSNRLLMSLHHNDQDSGPTKKRVKTDIIVAGSPLQSNTWLLTASNQTLRRFNIGIRLAPVTWTLAKSSAHAGAVANAAGAPGPLTSAAGTLNAGELCIAGNAERPKSMNLIGGYKPWKALTFGVDAKHLNSSYAYSLPEKQWVAYETPQSLASKLRHAHLLGKYNGIYVADTHADDVRSLCDATKTKPFRLMRALANFDNSG